MILESKERSAPFFAARRERLAERLTDEPFDAFLITEMANIRYLTGFSGTSATMLATADDSWFLTDSRYITQAHDQVAGAVAGVHIREYSERLEAVASLVKETGVKTLGFEAQQVSFAIVEEMRVKFKGVSLTPAEKIVESQRLIKDEPEIEAMRSLIGMLVKVYPEAENLIRSGAVERDVAVELEYRLKKVGADGAAFDFIVASGERSAMPHGVAGAKTIDDGDMVILDWGAKGWGYYSDTTRVLPVGKVSEELKNVYKIVLEANQAAIDSVRPGVALKDVDGAARKVIKDAGYGDNFGHGTGHGVGLFIHEDPKVSWTSESVAKAGMVFTIEPGVYLPGKGGARVEDMVHVTRESCEVLSLRLPKWSL
ncbi:Aminopeptidase YpdF (MP-, MA-, MS-, AP-, NP-specific) [hydrothermal vent metagenome]|uniref:Aminopeptidase YpdF (MP-, MA-, MS-, AP-, NP-specific) n=1 Tax=hydrothermal vent metagenome TaxID=652676 RepID=A0A3B1CM27_9ZZZZ